MVIATQAMQEKWQEDSATQTVIEQFVVTQTEPFTVAQVVSAVTASTITYAQAVWWLAYLATNRVSGTIALPESDAEMANAATLNHLW